MFLETLFIKVIDTEGDDCSYFDRIIRVHNKYYLRFYPENKKGSIGSYILCEDGRIAQMYCGNYTCARELVFLEGRKPNFYA
jgi:hypothetical protein